jgi:hypothetical protein
LFIVSVSGRTVLARLREIEGLQLLEVRDANGVASAFVHVCDGASSTKLLIVKVGQWPVLRRSFGAIRPACR